MVTAPSVARDFVSAHCAVSLGFRLGNPKLGSFCNFDVAPEPYQVAQEGSLVFGVRILLIFSPFVRLSTSM
jgi:hypothetical protein